MCDWVFIRHKHPANPYSHFLLLFSFPESHFRNIAFWLNFYILEVQSILALAQLTAHILHQYHTLAAEFVIIRPPRAPWGPLDSCLMIRMRIRSHNPPFF